jgi:hypothetical protein
LLLKLLNIPSQTLETLNNHKAEEDPGERQDSLSMPETRSDKKIKKIITEIKMN